MGLTTVARLKLEGKGFHTLFEQHQEHWTQMVTQARAVIAAHVPGGHPTADDVKKILFPMMELDPVLRDFRMNHQPKALIQNFWVSDFTDYILHRVLPVLHD